MLDSDVAVGVGLGVEVTVLDSDVAVGVGLGVEVTVLDSDVAGGVGLGVGAGVMVAPEPVSQTLPSGSVAIPLTILVPLPSVNTPFEYLTSIPCQPATLPDGDGFV